MTRRSFDETEFSRVKAAPVADDLPLFAQPAASAVPRWAETWGTLTDAERKAQRVRWEELLLPVVLDLAARHGPEGITASEVQAEGITRGVLWGERVFLRKYPRVYAWIGPWLSQLAARGILAPVMVDLPGGGQLHVTRKSERSLSHSNKGGVYVAARAA